MTTTQGLVGPGRRLRLGVVGLAHYHVTGWVETLEGFEDDILEGFGMESPFELMGLFSGIGMTEDGATPQTGQLPNTVYLYRRAILDYWAEHDDNTLGEIVTHVLIHELGHHFGFSDEEMEAIEAQADHDQA